MFTIEKKTTTVLGKQYNQFVIIKDDKGRSFIFFSRRWTTKQKMESGLKKFLQHCGNPDNYVIKNETGSPTRIRWASVEVMVNGFSIGSSPAVLFKKVDALKDDLMAFAKHSSNF